MNTSYLNQGIVRSGRIPNPTGTMGVIVNPSEPKGNKAMAKKARKKTSTKTTKRKKNPQNTSKKTSTKSTKSTKTTKRKKNPSISIKKLQDLVPVTAGALAGWALSGLLKAVVPETAKAKIASSLGSMSRLDVLLDLGAALALFWGADMNKMTQKHKESLLLGASLKIAHDLANEVLPATGLGKKARDVLGLPASATASATASPTATNLDNQSSQVSGFIHRPAMGGYLRREPSLGGFVHRPALGPEKEERQRNIERAKEVANQSLGGHFGAMSDGIGY